MSLFIPTEYDTATEYIHSPGIRTDDQKNEEQQEYRLIPAQSGRLLTFSADSKDIYINGGTVGAICARVLENPTEAIAAVWIGGNKVYDDAIPTGTEGKIVFQGHVSAQHREVTSNWLRFKNPMIVTLHRKS